MSTDAPTAQNEESSAPTEAPPSPQIENEPPNAPPEAPPPSENNENNETMSPDDPKPDLSDQPKRHTLSFQKPDKEINIEEEKEVRLVSSKDEIKIDHGVITIKPEYSQMMESELSGRILSSRKILPILDPTRLRARFSDSDEGRKKSVRVSSQGMLFVDPNKPKIESSIADIADVKDEDEFEHNMLDGSSRGSETDNIMAFEGEYEQEEEAVEEECLDGQQYLMVTPVQSFMKGVEFTEKFHPFKLEWVFGANVEVNILNLCDETRKYVVFSSGQSLVLYNLEFKSITILEGHRCGLSDITTDSTGQYLASVDRGTNCSMIIWDTLECKPIYTIFDPYPEEQEEEEEVDLDAVITYGEAEDFDAPLGTGKVAMSPNAKYIITVANNKPFVKFWLWTLGNDVCDDSHTVTPSNIGKCTGISYHPNCQEQIMISFEKAVYFTSWSTDENKFGDWRRMEIKPRAKFGKIVGCTFIENCHDCFALAELGAVHVFGTTTYYVPFESGTLNHNKRFIKTVKVSTSATMTTIYSVDGVLVIGDTLGRISFFDERLKILYWLQDFKFPGIASVSFNLRERKYRFEDPTVIKDAMFVLESPTEIIEGNVYDISEQVEILYKNMVPVDVTLSRNPFVIRNFVVLTGDSCIYSIDFVSSTFKLEYKSIRDIITVMETHTDFPYLAIAYKSGKIVLLNYETLDEIVYGLSFAKAIDPDDENPITITALKYSHDSYRMACGRSNGEVWFLEPILQDKTTTLPFLVTKDSVLKIRFSVDSNFCAYYDSNRTVVLFRYSHYHNEWRIHGKYRSHCKPITDLIFSPYVNHRFFTIAEDRNIIEYNAKKSTDEEIFIARKEVIEQSGVPLSIAYLPKEQDKKQALIYCTNQFKFKLLIEDNFYPKGTFLGPAYGCYSENPVNKILMCPKFENYLIFATDKHIGIQLLPLTGNPYTYLGMYGHPEKLSQICLSYDNQYLFTSGESDTCIFKWKINYESVDSLKDIGGKDLEPYFCLIEGGPTGWLFREMQDLFYYMQILHQDDNCLNQRFVSDKIPIVELPDLMRACGFYPTEFEVRGMLADIRKRPREGGEKKTECTFLEFVQLYLNHRPVHGMSMEELEDTYSKFCEYAGSYGAVDKDCFLDTITQKGENISLANLYKALSVLTNEPENTNDDDGSQFEFDFLPDSIGFYEIIDILGINTDEENRDILEANDED